MEIVNGKVVLGTKPCYCNDGTMFDIKWCQNRTKARGTHNCDKKTCPNNKTGYSTMHEISRRIVPCDNCKGGTVAIQENYCDDVTLPADFPIKVQRAGRANTFNENYLGLGCLYSCTDYGEFNKLTDEEVIAKIRTAQYHTKNGQIRTQAVKVVRSKDDLTLCDFILVNVTKDGYSVQAGFNN
jgi:hypothetical protein